MIWNLVGKFFFWLVPGTHQYPHFFIGTRSSAVPNFWNFLGTRYPAVLNLVPSVPLIPTTWLHHSNLVQIIWIIRNLTHSYTKSDEMMPFKIFAILNVAVFLFWSVQWFLGCFVAKGIKESSFCALRSQNEHLLEKIWLWKLELIISIIGLDWNS